MFGGREIFEEVTAPQCEMLSVCFPVKLTIGLGHFLGSVFVSLHARTFLDSTSKSRVGLIIQQFGQISSPVRHFTMIWSTLWTVSTKRRSSDSEIPKISSISSSARRETPMRSTIFVLDR